MISNAGAAQRTTHVIYPELPDPLTPDDLNRPFSPSYDERNWAPTVARTPHRKLGSNRILGWAPHTPGIGLLSYRALGYRVGGARGLRPARLPSPAR